MNQQTDWVTQVQNRSPPRKLKAILEECHRLADWYRAWKPEVTTIHVSAQDYKVLDAACGTHGIQQALDGLRYEGYCIQIAS